MPRFGLIIIGDEILSGKREDKHLHRVIQILAERGLGLSWARYVGDDPAQITQVLREAFASGDVVFSTGGIGSTPDDHTRLCAAKALGVDIQRHAEAKALIIERLQDVAREKGESFDASESILEQRLQMADFPQGAALIPNSYNKIAGFSCGQVYFVPGFPIMAWPMLEWVLDTHYAVHFHQTPQLERSLIVKGALEAKLTPLMLAIEAEFQSVKVFSLPSVAHPEYGAHIELGVKAQDAKLLQAAFQRLRDGLAGLNAVVLKE